MLIAEIATVRGGLAFREAIDHREGGRYGVVQAGDICVGEALNITGLQRVNDLPIKTLPPALQPGDVLLQCRGLSYRAAVVPPHERPLFATGSLLVLTPHEGLKPQYLVNFLNDPRTQDELRSRATGATIANLKRSEVEQLEVPLPSLEDQARICALSETLNEISRIEARILELRRIELRATIERCAQKNRKRVSASGSKRLG